FTSVALDTDVTSSTNLATHGPRWVRGRSIVPGRSAGFPDRSGHSPGASPGLDLGRRQPLGDGHRMLTMPIPEIPIGRFEVFATGLDHPECVAFDRSGGLWAGGEAGQIYRIDASGNSEAVASLGGFTGGLAFSPTDHALYACNPALGLVRVEADGRH